MDKGGKHNGQPLNKLFSKTICTRARLTLMTSCKCPKSLFPSLVTERRNLTIFTCIGFPRMIPEEEQETSLTRPIVMQFQRGMRCVQCYRVGLGDARGSAQTLLLCGARLRMRVGRSHKVMLSRHVVKRSSLCNHFLNINCMYPIYNDIDITCIRHY